MAIPTIVRTWQFKVNLLCTAATVPLLNGQLMRQIKNGLIGSGTFTDATGTTITPIGLWAVVGSSSSTAAGMDAVDRWAADTNVVWNTPGSAHSWIVLKQTGLASNFQLLFDLNTAGSGTTGTCGIYISPSAGFTGGSVTARPTATDEAAVLAPSASAVWGGPTTNADTRVHIMLSNDGAASRIILTRNGFVVSEMLIEKLGDVATGWSTPYIFSLFASLVQAPVAVNSTYALVSGGTSPLILGVSAALKSAFYSGEACRSSGGSSLLSARMTAANDLSGAFPLFPMGVFCNAASNVSRMGTLVDRWWALSSPAEATTYPNDGTRKLVQIGCTAMPWNGSVPNFF